jgi:hypothetical protein
MFGVAAPRESDVAVAGRDQGVRSSSDLSLEGDVVRGFCQTRWAALHSGEQVIACGRNGVSEAEAQAALMRSKQSLTTPSFSKVMLMQPVGSPTGCNVLRSDLTIEKAISLLHVVNQIL